MDAAEVAKEVNTRISNVGRTFGPELTLTFLCECGCLERVELTPDDYDLASGAWAAGHGGRRGRHEAAQ